MKRFLIALVAAAVTLVACGGGATPTPAETAEEADAGTHPEGTVAAVLEADGRFTTLLRIVEEEAPSFFLDAMTAPGWDHTVLAPTDEAFEALPPGALKSMLETGLDAKRLLDNHLVVGVIPSDALGTELTELPVVAGNHELGADAEGVRIGEASIVEPDIEASNGLIHAIDAVLTQVCRQIGTTGPLQCMDITGEG